MLESPEAAGPVAREEAALRPSPSGRVLPEGLSGGEASTASTAAVCPVLIDEATLGCVVTATWLDAA